MKLKPTLATEPNARTTAFAGLALLVLLFVFYPELFLARSASLMGDHWEQHYPWAFLMAKSLKLGILPFWTPLIQCGFPIVAESQMGLFYLPNMVFYSLLPFRWAYAYMNVFHFCATALGTLLYARRIGLNSWGSFTAAMIFVFGAGYGGAYYNITSLKTLAWLPWVLWSFEAFYRSKRWRYAALAAGFMALAILAGYLQVAALMLFFCLLYFFFRLLFFVSAEETGRGRLLAAFGILAALACALMIALPQFLLTFELSQLSNRVDLAEGYAYVGSLSPGALLTLVFPNLQGLFRGTCLYSGIFSIFFCIAAFFVSFQPLQQMTRLWAWMAATALVLALGQWSPLYIALVKVTHFYSFRIPAKFLIFFCFAVAILSGIGVHAIAGCLFRDEKARKKMTAVGFAVAGAIPVVWACVYAALSLGRSWILAVGEWVVRNFIYGQPGHPKTMEEYLAALQAQIDRVRETLSGGDPWLLWAFALLLAAALWLLFFRRGARAAVLLLVAFGILLVDFYVLAGADIKKDFAGYDRVLQPNAIVQELLTEKAEGKLGRIYVFRKESENPPLKPSVNMLYGIEDIGGYSPLIFGRYFEAIGQLGNVNDSNRMFDPSPGFVLERLPLLDALDVSHVISMQPLHHPDLQLLMADPVTHAVLYRNTRSRVRAFFISGAVSFADWPRLKEMLMAPGFDPRSVLLLENDAKAQIRGIRLSKDTTAIRLSRTFHDTDSERWTIETTGPGFFVLANTFYPGWNAFVDQMPVPLLRAYGLFQAVYVPGPGSHDIALEYDPWHRRGERP